MPCSRGPVHTLPSNECRNDNIVSPQAQRKKHLAKKEVVPAEIAPDAPFTRTSRSVTRANLALRPIASNSPKVLHNKHLALKSSRRDQTRSRRVTGTLPSLCAPM